MVLRVVVNALTLLHPLTLTAYTLVKVLSDMTAEVVDIVRLTPVTKFVSAL